MKPAFPVGCVDDVRAALKAHCANGDLVQYPEVRNWTDYKYSPQQTGRAIALFADNIGLDNKTHISIFRVRM